ncbi:hypothetical protein BDZ45DRAFT_783992 [Acephala macrosclerotiorum]|nr:hypothetical protein BDZ45DRAFT_783992 [Acephala macrosclerotiorum]
MASKSQSRAMSPKTSTRRPKLMRAAATAPSLATSNASRQDLASLQNSRAATLLTTLANYSTHHGYEHARRTSDGSMCSSPGRSPESEMSARRESFEVLAAQSNYFSFPSFEDFQEYHEDQERRESRQENGVP